MKKIIAAFDGLKFSQATADYAIEICKQNDDHLVGVFLEDVTYHSYKLLEVVKEGGTPENAIQRFEEKDKEVRKASVVKFKTACAQAGINFSVHHDHSIALRELLHETVYADLLVIDSSETLSHYDEGLPTRFIRDILADVQCPVLLVPKKYEPVQKVFLLYDGESSSVYAIKMFSYLMQSFKSLPTEVLTVRAMRKDRHVPDNKVMREFMKRHFSGETYTVLNGFPEIEITEYLKKQPQNFLIAIGAYRRGMVSRWFRESMADILMEELSAPLFIAHNK